jgi:predicted secreted protein
MNMITQKSGLVILGVILFIILLVAGCLGSDQQHPANAAATVRCTETLVPGQNMTISDAQDNATICAKLNSSMRIELPDPTKTGGEWSMTASSGLQVTDEGLIVRYFNVSGTSLQVPPGGEGLVTYTHAWNVTMTGTGVQTIKGYTRFPAAGRPDPEEKFNLTVVVG